MTLSTFFRAANAATATGLLLVSASASALAIAEPAPIFSGLVVFGDSLSDNGRLFALDGGTFPLAPYFQGRFSNGPVAVERLAAGLNLSGAQFQDLAIAGATTGTAGPFGAGAGIAFGGGMLQQLGGYSAALAGAGATADSQALYFVWGGANDLRAAGAGAGAAIAPTINNLVNIVTTLHGLGARNFMLPNLPDLGLTPEAREAGVSASASLVSGAFNQQLSLAYASLAQTWTDEHFYYVDAMGAQQAITSGSPGNGFTNVSTGCITTAGCVAADGAGFLYWDQIHPTAVTHQLLGNAMLAAVPEPASMLLMAAGLLTVIGLGRRRQA